MKFSADNNGTTTEVMWQHMQIYLAYGGVNTFGTLLGLSALTVGCIWTSTSLHNKMLDAILRAPMSFFDSTPTGRILNRYRIGGKFNQNSILQTQYCAWP